jgi:hypothetical protein
MSEEAICHRLEISLEERRAKYGLVRLLITSGITP